MEKYLEFLLELNSNDNYSIIEFLDEGAIEVDIPSTYKGISIDTIKSMAFFDKDNIKKISIPDTIKFIENHSFVGLSNLSDVFIFNYVEGLSKIFVDCPLDTCFIVGRFSYELFIAENNHFCFFIQCEYLKQQDEIGLDIDSNGILRISEPYKTLYIPDNIQAKIYNQIYDSIQYVRDNKNNIISSYNIFHNLLGTKFSETVTTIQSNSFLRTNIRFIKISKNIETIKDKAFLKCLSLKEVEISENISSIGVDVFEGTPFFENLRVISQKKRNCLISFDYIALAYDSSINKYEKELIFSDNIKVLTPDFKGIDVIKITIGQNIKEIPRTTFFNCENLKEVFIGKNVELIGEYAFGNDLEIERGPLVVNYEDELNKSKIVDYTAFIKDDSPTIRNLVFNALRNNPKTVIV